MNTQENDFGLSPEEIGDERFRLDDNTATNFDGEVWWSWNQFVNIHCQHVGRSVRRLVGTGNTIERQSGAGVVGDMEMPDGGIEVCLPRWAALRYLHHRKQNRQALAKHRNRFRS